MEVFKEIFPEEYYAQFLDHGVRPDGRAEDDVRAAIAHCGAITTALGSAIVRMGKTSVVAGVTGQVMPSELLLHAAEDGGDEAPEAPAEAAAADMASSPCVIVNTELMPLCSGKFKPGKPSLEQQSLCAQLNELFATGVVDESCLWIKDKEGGGSLGRWVLIVDVYCLNHDGCVVDASVAAVVAALSSTTLPTAFLSPDRSALLCSSENNVRVKLMDTVPLSATFSVVHQRVIADPTSEEEDLESARLNVVMASSNDGPKRLLSFSKSGSAVMDEEQLRDCLRKAEARIKQWSDLIRSASSDALKGPENVEAATQESVKRILEKEKSKKQSKDGAKKHKSKKKGSSKS
eukprot:TRINITY_DN11601_c0_g1_i1.p1 TRINITY_DN11601_c0_g1~~TRINITY_DN11601_c0_g1_i1.p1  ORF type:complete len:366 (-),score=113.75 TRINITY_DN11601_c0_g1_i1:51-1094(-)